VPADETQENQALAILVLLGERFTLQQNETLKRR
jgi:hypothetical protein